MTTIDSLTPYHRSKVLNKAKEYRLTHAKEIVNSMKGCLDEIEPHGTALFDPSKWTPANWVWFYPILVKMIQL